MIKVGFYYQIAIYLFNNETHYYPYGTIYFF